MFLIIGDTFSSVGRIGWITHWFVCFALRKGQEAGSKTVNKEQERAKDNRYEYTSEADRVLVTHEPSVALPNSL